MTTAPPATTSPTDTAAHTDYRVELDAYAGPLDLLLHLVKRHEIDLHDIPIARLTEQYLHHLQVIRFLDMDQAGEFLVMAATLVEIKSQMLVPPDERTDETAATGESETVGDPRLELVHQLLAYKRFKDAAIALEHRHDEWSNRFSIRPVKSAKPQAPAPGPGPGSTPTTADGGSEDADNAPVAELDLEDVHIMDLCEAFARILDSIGSRKFEHEVTYDDTPISLHADDIYDRLTREGRLTLTKVFEGRTTRSEMIGLFLATLELAKQRRIKVVQDETSGELALERRSDAEQKAIAQREDAAGATDWRDPATGEPQYDWPDEAAQRRFERRLRIRGARAAQGHLADVPMIEALDDDAPLDDDHEADFDAEHEDADETLALHDPLDEDTEEDLLDDAA